MWGCSRVTGSLGIRLSQKKAIFTVTAQLNILAWPGKRLRAARLSLWGAPSGQNIIMKWQARGQIKSALNLPLITNHTAASGCGFPRKLYQKPFTRRGSGLEVTWGYVPSPPRFLAVSIRFMTGCTEFVYMGMC